MRRKIAKKVRRKKPSIREAARMEARFGAGVDEMQKSIGSAIAGPGAGKKRKKRKKKKPVEGMLEKQGYMDLYEGPSKEAKKKRRFTKVDEVV